MLTSERLRQLLNFDPDTGNFVWLEKVAPNIEIGSRAGWIRSDKRYKMIRIDGKYHYAHRLAWLYVHGRWPDPEIDHVNGDGLDNRLCNLRQASRSNNVNNTRPPKNSTGFPGVSKYRRKWRATVRIGGKTKSLGYWPTPEEAHAAYVKAVNSVHGEFSRFHSISQMNPG